MFNGRAKPKLKIGDPDKHLPDNWSSTVDAQCAISLFSVFNLFWDFSICCSDIMYMVLR
jgi:hypothetical protein